jgi:hypothetical protein
MDGLLPEFIKGITNKIPHFGGSGDGSAENSATTSLAANNNSSNNQILS